MSVDAMNWAFDSDATHACRLVLLALSHSHNGKTQLCCPSIARLCVMTRLGRTSVLAAIKSLEKSGHIQVSRKTGCGSRYILNFVSQCRTETSSNSVPVQNMDDTSSDAEPDGFKNRPRKGNVKGNKTQPSDAGDRNPGTGQWGKQPGDLEEQARKKPADFEGLRQAMLANRKNDEIHE
jgi:hypothetical protein